ncbi:peroxisomal biogenesis factor 11, partial [Penicillium atrosanguineum]
MSLIRQFYNFTHNTAGLAKIFRLIQAISQIVIEFTVDDVSASRWAIAKSQLALSRRYLSFFEVIDSFDRVAALLSGETSGHGIVWMLVDLARWSCLGTYLLLEDLTILHIMNVYPVSWNGPVLEQAYKFRFYALALSVFGATWGLIFCSSGPSKASMPKDERQGTKKVKSSGKKSVFQSTSRTAVTSILVKRIIVDSCDLLIPGSILGWIAVSDLGVAVAMLFSTVVSGKD